MNIKHFISSIDNSTGGPARSVTHLIAAMLEDSKHKIELYCGESPNPIRKDFEKSPGSIQFCKPNRFTGFKGIGKMIGKNNPDLLHGHGLWQMPVHNMAKTARKNKIPYVITPRGMLDKWPLNHKKIKKKIALALFQDKDIKGASVIHATSIIEARNIRELGYINPIAIIPNGINLNHVTDKNRNRSGTKKKILFLSRLIKNKGIEELLNVWSSINFEIKKDWNLIIVGDGDIEYVKKLKRIKNDLEMQDVFFEGAAYGHAKDNYFLEANLFVLPSYTENFGIAIAEALSFKIPVITTKGTPWEELNTTLGGWCIEIGVEPLKAALEKALQTPPETLLLMGQNGRKLVEEKYSIDAVSKQMLELYTWILKKGQKPDFVNII